MCTLVYHLKYYLKSNSTNVEHRLIMKYQAVKYMLWFCICRVVNFAQQLFTKFDLLKYPKLSKYSFAICLIYGHFSSLYGLVSINKDGFIFILIPFLNTLVQKSYIEVFSQQWNHFKEMLQDSMYKGRWTLEMKAHYNVNNFKENWDYT
jgi:hypothetical protein